MTDEVTVRLTDDGPIRYSGGGIRCDRGDEVTTNADHADYLVENYGFELIAEESSDDSTDENPLTDLKGVGESTADALQEAGYTSVDSVRGASAEDLVAINGIGETLAAELSEVDD